MGGDHGLRVSLPAALQSLSRFEDIDLILVGDQTAIQEQLSASAGVSARLRIIHAEQVVAMDEKPSHALKQKRDSSMRIAIDLLASDEVDAVVSAGNTGALMAMGTVVLKTLDGIQRPAICTALPTSNGQTHILDLGANVDTTAEQLYQFAVMGNALVSAVYGTTSPRVALLNIGEEAIKGNEQVKEAAALLEADPRLNYIGPIEGNALLKGDVDVVVCDGFVGNVALKVMEGTASHIAEKIHQAFSHNWLSRLQGAIAYPILKRMYRQVDPQQYNGASLLGLQGVVVKSHGDSSVSSFQHAIAQARNEVQQNLLGEISQQLSTLNRNT
jgi:glycerol-3-phosphate acyltransferase PlsX